MIDRVRIPKGGWTMIDRVRQWILRWAVTLWAWMFWTGHAHPILWGMAWTVLACACAVGLAALGEP